MAQKPHPFTAEEYAARVELVRDAIRERELDALLITSPENIYYLVGLYHQGYFAFTMLVFPLEGTPVIVTRSMERMTVITQAPDCEHVGFGEGESPGDAVRHAVCEVGLERGRIGVEKNEMFFPPVHWEQIQAELSDVRWTDASGLIEETRRVKSPQEIAYIRQAAAISDRALRAGVRVAGVGINEQEVAAEVYAAMILGGSGYPGFAPLIRSSETFAHEHGTWQDRVLVPGDGLFIELSAAVARYHAPLGRTVYVGRAPAKLRAAADVALEAIEAVRVALRPGVIAGDVYETWQRVVDRHLGSSVYRRHHCGYTVGIGFPPSWVGGSNVVGLRPGSKYEIKAGMVFHLLSWILDTPLDNYLVSDTCLVTDTGAELLTSAAHDLTVW